MITQVQVEGTEVVRAEFVGSPADSVRDAIRWIEAMGGSRRDDARDGSARWVAPNGFDVFVLRSS